MAFVDLLIRPWFREQVVKLIPGGPAAKNGRLLVGDKLRMINDIDITQMPLEEFPALISGPMGSSVKAVAV